MGSNNYRRVFGLFSLSVAAVEAVVGELSLSATMQLVSASGDWLTLAVAIFLLASSMARNRTGLPTSASHSLTAVPSSQEVKVLENEGKTNHRRELDRGELDGDEKAFAF